MNKDSLGDRMKRFEESFDFSLPIRIPMMLRIDGKNFHSMVKKWKCIKPFDNRLQKAMSYTAQELCRSIEGARLAYVQSDEITIVVYDDMTRVSQPWFDKRLSKILSISSSIATRAFNSFPYFDPSIDTIDCLGEWLDVDKHPAIFDSRVWVMPENEVKNNFIWRQQDASRNSVQMLARSLYSHKEVTDNNNSELQEMCFQKGSNWNDLPTWQKRGWCIVKQQIECENQYGKFMRNKWIEDLEIPVFTKSEYLNEKLKSPENE